jgi:hypothetical protein
MPVDIGDQAGVDAAVERVLGLWVLGLTPLGRARRNRTRWRQ